MAPAAPAVPAAPAASTVSVKKINFLLFLLLLLLLLEKMAWSRRPVTARVEKGVEKGDREKAESAAKECRSCSKIAAKRVAEKYRVARPKELRKMQR